MASKNKKSEKARLSGFTSLAQHEDGIREGYVVISDFGDYELRRIWHRGEWMHSVVDVVRALAVSKAADQGAYWRKLKQRMVEREGANEIVTDCHDLKLPASDGKAYPTDCANTKTLFRIIESVPSPHAEPIKQFLAEVGAERLEEMASPSKAVDRAIDHYRALGRDDDWIDHRLQNISARNEMTDEWNNRGVKTGQAALTNEMSAMAMGVQPKNHAQKKGIKRSELRDNMDKTELAITTVSETSAKAIMVQRDTQTFADSHKASIDGASVARAARVALEEQLGRPVASKHNFIPKPDGSDTPLFKAAARKQGGK